MSLFIFLIGKKGTENSHSAYREEMNYISLQKQHYRCYLPISQKRRKDCTDVRKKIWLFWYLSQPDYVSNYKFALGSK